MFAFRSNCRSYWKLIRSLRRMRLLVISPSPNEELAKGMLQTARRVGLDPIIYGQNARSTHGSDYQGTDIVQLLRERTDAQYVLGVDAFDVAFLAGEDEIMSKVSEFQHPFILSAEHDGV